MADDPKKSSDTSEGPEAPAEDPAAASPQGDDSSAPNKTQKKAPAEDAATEGSAPDEELAAASSETVKSEEEDEALPTLAESPAARAKLQQLQREAHEADETARREALAREEAGRIAAAVTPAAAEVANAPLPKAWGTPIARFDAMLTVVEERLLLAVLLVEIGALVVWVALRGFSLGESDTRNLILRIPMLAGAFAAIGAWIASRAMRGSAAAKHVPLAAAVVGALLAILTRNAGVFYFQNILNWLQNASSLMLVGGLRGLVTRLTLWLALLGASLATSKGKHINIDVVMRFLPVSYRVPVALIGWLSAAIMCVTGAWGFVDQLALGEFRVERTDVCPGYVAPPVVEGEAAPPAPQCEVGPGVKLAGIREEAGRDLFLLGRQISLDLKSIPRVFFAGEAYDKWFTPADWNAWWKDGGWDAHYKAEDVKAQILSEENTEPRIPAVTIPGGDENPSGILIRDLNLVLPFGLLIIAIRFLIRSLLALSGHIVVDPDAAHAEDDDLAHGVPQPQTAPVAVADAKEVL